MSQSRGTELLATLSSSEASDLKNRVVRKIMRRGRACAPDLANEIKVGTKSPHLIAVDDLLTVLHELVAEGILREATDPDKSRNYEPPYQTVFELAI